MSYNAYITKIKGIRKHSNADRLQVGTVFGNSVIIGLDVVEDELGLYFPTDGRLGVEYCEANNLLRKKDENGNNIGGYLEPDKRHVSTLKLRGEASDGLFMPLKSLKKFCDISQLKDGDIITILKGITICEKYIPRGKTSNNNCSESKLKTKSLIKYPYFSEHIDTSQLAYNLNQFKAGDLCYITLKMNGTSQRTGYMIKEKSYIFPNVVYKFLKWINRLPNPKQSWEYVTGTRRVVLSNFESGYHGSNNFRQKYHEDLKEKLQKGESIYYELVGYTQDSQLIMPECNNKKTKDKEFIKQYGESTKFTYGCDIGQNDMYVYRMTMTNEDGYVIEMPWELVKLRCEQMGIKYVPEFDKFIFTTQEDLMERVNNYVDGTDPIGKSHIKEGVVVRIEGKQKFSAYKHKSFNFKVLEGIIKADDVLDMEEVESN